MVGPSRIDELRKKFDENPRRYFAPLANEYRKLGDYEQAIFICQEFLPQQPGHMSGHIVYGQALFESGKYDESRAVFETALSLDPENLIALRHLGDIARAGGDLDTARAWYRRVLESDPRNEEIANVLRTIDSEGAGPSPADVTAVGVAPGEPMGVERDRSEGTSGARVAAADEVADQNAGNELARPETETTASAAGLGGGDADRSSGTTPPSPERDHAADAAFAALLTRTNDAMGGSGDGDAGREPSPSLVESAPEPTPAPSYSIPGLESHFDATVGDTPSAAAAAGSPDASATSSSEASGPGEAGSRPPARRDDDASPATTPASAEPAAPESSPPRNEADFDALFAMADSSPAAPAAPASSSAPASAAAAPKSTAPSPGMSSTPQVPVADAFVNETMAELYLAQGHRDAALDVYRQLVKRRPSDAALRARLQEIESPDEYLERTVASTEPALAGPTIREYLAALARYLPGAEPEEAAAPDPADVARLSGPTGAITEAMETPPMAPSAPEAESEPEIPPTGAVVGDIELVADNALAPPERPLAAEREAGVAKSLDQLFAEAEAASIRRDPGGDGSDAQSPIDAMLADGPASVDSARSEPAALPGRPSSPAASELSLDHVFRHATPASGSPQAPSFSFDQFFSQQAQQDATGTTSEPSREASGAEGDDIQQFNAWLEGLKKS